MRDKGLYASISLGVKKPTTPRSTSLVAEGLGADYITIDIAHGHADSVQEHDRASRSKLPATFVIAGNVATPEAVIDLENWGADATKVGIGPGQGLHHQAQDRFWHRRLAARRSSGAPAWRPSPSLPTAASASTATSPRASVLAPRW
jgi:hypothetical protein